MLTKDEIKELKFFADKVANVHGDKHPEYIRINEILINIENLNQEFKYFKEIQILTNNYIIPDWACKAETTLLNLLKKMDESI